MSQAFPPRLLLVLPGPLPSATIYIIKPLQELARQNRVKFTPVMESQVNQAWLRASDIVLFCRNINPEYDWILEDCQAQRIPTAYDLDDNFWEVPAGFAYSAYHHAPERIRQLERYLRQVDRVRVYSRPLAERALAFNTHVCRVVPCIDMSLVPAEPLPKREQKLRITYVTGRGGNDTLIGLFAADLLRLLEQNPGAIEVTWWGEVPELFRGHPSSRMVDLIHDYDQFLRFLAAEGFDIGLAPLTPTSFNLAKTNTKFRDYGACRIAGIYSDVPVYSACVEQEKTGLLVSDRPGAWLQAMQRLIIDTELREGIREAAYGYVYENYRQELVELQWLELIGELMQQKQPAFPGISLPAVEYKAPRAAPAETQRRRVRICLSDGTAPDGYLRIARPWQAQARPSLSDIEWRPPFELIAQPEALPFAAGAVDVVLIDRTLDDIPAPDAALAEIYRVAGDTAAVVIHAASGSAVIDPLLKAPQNNRGAAAGLHCVQVETFYRQDLLHLSEAEKRRHLQEDPAVREAVLFRCLAIKNKALDAQELDEMAKGTRWDEPLPVSLRRQAEAAETLKDQFGRSLDETNRLKARLKAKEAEVYAREVDLHELKHELAVQMPRARLLATALEAQHGRRINRLIERLTDRRDYSRMLIEAYRQLFDDSLIYLGGIRGYRLRPGPSFQTDPFRSYSFRINRPGLTGIAIAPIFDLFPRSGELALEVIAAGSVLAQAACPVARIEVDHPRLFEFKAIRSPLPAGTELRLSGRDLDVPVRIYEWQQYPLLGLGRLKIKPFIGLKFEE